MTSSSNDNDPIILITCIANRGVAVPREQRGNGDSDDSIWPLTPGRKYPALAMMIWQTSLTFLVPDNYGQPLMAPVALFDVGSWEMPAHWHFGVYSGAHLGGQALEGTPLVAAWGYREFVTGESHIDDLLEFEHPALEIFVDQVSRAGGFEHH